MSLVVRTCGAAWVAVGGYLVASAVGDAVRRFRAIESGAAPVSVLDIYVWTKEAAAEVMVYGCLLAFLLFVLPGLALYALGAQMIRRGEGPNDGGRR